MASTHSITEFQDHFLLFCESGFIAVNQSDEDSAVKMFQAAQTMNQENLLPQVGLGYLHMMKLELKQAEKHFQHVLKKDPAHETAKTFLAFCYTLTTAQVSDGEQLLTELASTTKDPMIKELNESILDFVDNFVKKDPTPMDIKKNNKKK